MPRARDDAFACSRRQLRGVAVRGVAASPGSSANLRHVAHSHSSRSASAPTTSGSAPTRAPALFTCGVAAGEASAAAPAGRGGARRRRGGAAAADSEPGEEREEGGADADVVRVAVAHVAGVAGRVLGRVAAEPRAACVP